MQSKNILVVDDEPSIRALYQIAFSHSGYEVRVACNGEDAVEMQEEAPAKIIFLDLNLPGIKGNQLCGELLQKWPDTRIIAITGDLKSYSEKDLMDVGFHHVLYKPVELSDLLSAAQGSPGED